MFACSLVDLSSYNFENDMEKLTVIKVGGKIVEEEDTLCKLLDDFAAIPG